MSHNNKRDTHLQTHVYVYLHVEAARPEQGVVQDFLEKKKRKDYLITTTISNSSVECKTFSTHGWENQQRSATDHQTGRKQHTRWSGGAAGTRQAQERK